MKPIIAVAVATVVLTGTAHAQDAVPSKKKPHSERRVCRAMATTGSIMRNSECHTPAEWATIDAANQASAKTFTDQQSRGGATLPR